MRTSIISYGNNIFIYYVYYVFITDKTNEAIKCEFYMYWVCKKIKKNNNNESNI